MVCNFDQLLLPNSLFCQIGHCSCSRRMIRDFVSIPIFCAADLNHVEIGLFPQWTILRPPLYISSNPKWIRSYKRLVSVESPLVYIIFLKRRTGHMLRLFIFVISHKLFNTCCCTFSAPPR